MKINAQATKGFTLTELLLVTSIIALLSSLILAASVRTIGKGIQASCANNLRQINCAVRLYADDYSVFPRAASSWPPNPFLHYATLIKSYLGSGADPSNHPKVLACPADTFYYKFETMARGFRIAQSVHAQPPDFSSYGFNGGNFPYGSNQLPRWPGIAGLKDSSVKEPSKTVLVEEFAALIPYSWHEPASAPGHYNNAKCILSFVDGHASCLKIYWDAANASGAHLEAWQYDPPPHYDYRWSAN
jgi:prepilin-type N-terminal cleavage/methylation domain-containing protein